MLGELYIQCSGGASHYTEIATVFVVANRVPAAIQPAKLNLALVVRRVKGVVHAVRFPDGMCLRAIEADIVEATQVLAARQHFLLIEADPFLPDVLFFGCQIVIAPLIRVRAWWPGELRSDHPADPHGRSEILPSVAQF